MTVQLESRKLRWCKLRSLQKDKRGMEELRAIIYVFYISVIIIIGIFLVRGLLTNVCVVAEDRASNLDYNALASRVVYSPECFAAEGQYIDKDGNQRIFADPGILDATKLSDSTIDNCIKYTGGDFELSIRDLDGAYYFKDSSACAGDVGRSGDWERREDLLVQIKDTNGDIVDGVMRFCLDVDPQTIVGENCR